MSPRRRKPDGGHRLPAWIVSFTDMTTLLLSFFIMLQAFAQERDVAMFELGQGGFIRAIAGLGIPNWLFGEDQSLDLGHQARKHPTKEDTSALGKNRLIDPEDERIRRLFEDLRQLTKAELADYQGRPARLLTTPITFAPSDTTLGEEAKTFLRDFASNLRQTGRAAAPCIHVIGLAPEESDPRVQWTLSADRALAVESFLARELPDELKGLGARVDSWGAGRGGPWFGQTGAVTQQMFVVLAVMESQAKE